MLAAIQFRIFCLPASLKRQRLKHKTCNATCFLCGIGESMEERDDFADLDVDGRIILKFNLKK
jgi:hypothetical protein